MTEHDLQAAIYSRIEGSGKVILPNYNPPLWFECDVWALTRALYSVEYEIKLSPSDFHADKRKRIWRDSETKHELLAQGDHRGPSRFFFVMPAGLVNHDSVPTWAGIIEAERRDHYIRLRTCREAPRLHKVQVPPRRIAHAASSLCFRYWQARREMATQGALS